VLPGRGEPGRAFDTRGGHEPMRPSAETARRESARPGRGLGPADPIRSGRDALLASLERPLGTPRESPLIGDAPSTGSAPSEPRRARGAAALIGAPTSPFDEDRDGPDHDMPAVPSLAVLRPRLKSQPPEPPGASSDRPRKRLPSWDDVLFGSAPARETS
jgi:hypothetical protein